jgi:hypothetical protein
LLSIGELVPNNLSSVTPNKEYQHYGFICLASHIKWTPFMSFEKMVDAPLLSVEIKKFPGCPDPCAAGSALTMRSAIWCTMASSALDRTGTTPRRPP